MHIYTDGTVLVTHGGVEMGQGLHTKMAQIAAQSLGLPLNAVYMAETATDKVPNASSTAASASSDIYGGAGRISHPPLQLQYLFDGYHQLYDRAVLSPVLMPINSLNDTCIPDLAQRGSCGKVTVHSGKLSASNAAEFILCICSFLRSGRVCDPRGVDQKYTCAVGDACRQLNERLAPYKQSMKGAKFEEIVRTAHMDRIDLSAHGWYITPDITGELRPILLSVQHLAHIHYATGEVQFNPLEMHG